MKLKSFIVLSLSILLAGCDAAPISTPPNTRILSTDTPQSPEWSASTPTQTAEYTPMPTMSTTESERFVVEELLGKNKGCSLPCVWGVVPGKTKYQEAKRFFEHLGWKGHDRRGVDSDKDYLYENDYLYETGKDIGVYRKGSPTQSGGFPVVVDVAIYTSNDRVEKLHLAVGGNEFVDKVGYFSFLNIIKELGKPSKILMDNIGVYPSIDILPNEARFDLVFYYEEKNIMIEYTGTAIKIDDSYHFCPTRPNAESTQVDPMSGNVSLYIGISGQDKTPQRLVPPFWILPNYYISSEQVLGMSIDKFYEMVSQSDSDVCFDTH